MEEGAPAPDAVAPEPLYGAPLAGAAFYVATSAKRGGVNRRGLFAARDLVRGDVIERCPTIPISLAAWQKHCRHTELVDYGYRNPRTRGYLMCIGSGSLFNHSNKPNVMWSINDDSSITFRIPYTLALVPRGTELCTFYAKPTELAFEYTPSEWSMDSESSTEESDSDSDSDNGVVGGGLFAAPESTPPREAVAATSVSGSAAAAASPLPPPTEATTSAPTDEGCRFDTVDMWNEFHAGEGGNDGLYDWYSAGELLAQICAALASRGVRRRDTTRMSLSAALHGVMRSAKRASDATSPSFVQIAAVATVEAERDGGASSAPMHPALPALAVLDIGVGTSEVLFHLAGEAAVDAKSSSSVPGSGAGPAHAGPARALYTGGAFSELVGVDFSPICIERLRSEVAARGLDTTRVRFYVGDALALAHSDFGGGGSGGGEACASAFTPSLLVDKVSFLICMCGVVPFRAF